MSIWSQIKHHSEQIAKLVAEAARKEAEAQAELARKAEEAIK